MSKNNSELDSKNNCNMIIYYTIRLNTFIIIKMPINLNMEVRALILSAANFKNLKYWKLI